MSPTLCAWHDYVTGESLCSGPAAYMTYHADCVTCAPADCVGAAVCVEHAAVLRRDDDIARMCSIESAVAS